MDDMTKKRLDGSTKTVGKVFQSMTSAGAQATDDHSMNAINAALKALGVPEDRVSLFGLPFSLLLYGAQGLTAADLTPQQIKEAFTPIVAATNVNKVVRANGGCTCANPECSSRLIAIDQALRSMQLGYLNTIEYLFTADTPTTRALAHVVCDTLLSMIIDAGML